MTKEQKARSFLNVLDNYIAIRVEVAKRDAATHGIMTTAMQVERIELEAALMELLNGGE